jgi:hypothetical protein
MENLSVIQEKVKEKQGKQQGKSKEGRKSRLETDRRRLRMR